MARLYHRCEHRKGINESDFEKWLLSSVAAKLDEGEELHMMAAKQAPKSTAKAKRAAVIRKLEKLKELFLDDLITKDDYRRDYDKLQAELAALPDIPEDAGPDFDALRKILEGDFQSRYEKMDRAGRRSFWRSLIEQVTFDVENKPTVYFKGFRY